MRSLARQVRSLLGPIHDWFRRIATAMEIWTDVWEEAASAQLLFRPSRSSNGAYQIPPGGNGYRPRPLPSKMLS